MHNLAAKRQWDKWVLYRPRACMCQRYHKTHPFTLLSTFRKWQMKALLSILTTFVFYHLRDLTAALATDFSEFIKEDDFGFGFIQPGHVSKGRQISPDGDIDIENMYNTYKGKKQIILWVKVLKRKKVCPSTGDTASKKQCQSSECAGSNYLTISFKG